MFNCARCKKTQPAHTKIEKLVLETRAVTYTRSVKDEETGTMIPIVIAQGSEIVREINVCAACKADATTEQLAGLVNCGLKAA